MAKRRKGPVIVEVTWVENGATCVDRFEGERITWQMDRQPGVNGAVAMIKVRDGGLANGNSGDGPVTDVGYALCQRIVRRPGGETGDSTQVDPGE